MLASPIINGTLPAFYAKEDGTATITVPFSMSRAVKQSEVKGFKLKIKNIQGSVYSDSLSAIDSSNFDYNKFIVEFNLNQEQIKNFLEGSFYKVQIAYIDQMGIVGYYSTVGIIKFTTRPKVYISNLKNFENNLHSYNYVGVYSQENKDVTEKVYSYRFVFKDEDDNVIEDTGYQIHNSSNDTEFYESQDNFFLNIDLDKNKKYKITYIIKTNNGLEISSPIYKIIKRDSIDSILKAEIKTSLNYENGYINIGLNGEKDKKGEELSIKGSFILSRSSEKTNYETWEEILRFNLISELPSSKNWKDFAIEQGIKYKYSIQQYNNQGLYSERIISEEIYADFEHCFLFDGKRQLKIKFNPKISSFKTDLLEAKVDTIGSKYPFIFRNGNVEYKEFPINGLISYLMDEESLFLDNKDKFYNQQRQGKFKYISKIPTKKEFEKNYWCFYKYINKQYVQVQKDEEYNKRITYYYRIVEPVNKIDFKKYKYANTNLESDNITLEREFKLEVLNWLNNGKPKLFKSPNEGNYIVRLMNSSLTPEETLGRMLHNFSCTAYEIAKFEYEQLVKYNILNIVNEIEPVYLKSMTIPLMTQDENYANSSPIKYEKDDDSNLFYATGELLNVGSTIEFLTLTDIIPGTEFYLNNQPIIIGSTGTYNIPIQVNSLKLIDNKSTGFLTISYYTKMNDIFNNILETNLKTILGHQFIGEYNNIIDNIENIETTISNIYDIKVYNRPIQEAFFITDYKVANQDEIYYWTTDDGKYSYKNYYILNEKDEYVSANEYNNKQIYYQKELSLCDSMGNMLFNEIIFNKKNVPLEDLRPNIFQSYDKVFNPLDVYKYTKNEDEKLGKQYSEIFFKDTSNTNKITQGDITNLNNRTSSNPYLKDYRDFELYVNNQMLYDENYNLIPIGSIFDINKKYYIQDKIEFIYVPQEPNQIYLTEKSYNYFINKGFQNIVKLYNSNVYIDSIKINLENYNYYNTGNIKKISTLQTSIGIYCELFYQISKINYDLSNSIYLQNLKKEIDSYNNFLSKEYLIEQCYYNNNYEDYNQLISKIRNDYNEDYNIYLNELENYLKKLELEG